MKKFLSFAFLAVGLLLAGNANAQLGVHLGYAPDAWTDDNSTTDFTTIFAGVDYNMPITGDLMVNIGGQLRYSTESGSGSVLGLASAEHTTTLFSLDVPILLNYGFNLTSDLRLTLFAGPKLSYYLSGKTEYKGNVLGLISGSTESEWFGDDNAYDPFNLTGTFGLAFSYNQFRLFGGYNLGLIDLDHNDNLETTVSGLFFGLGMEL